MFLAPFYWTKWNSTHKKYWNLLKITIYGMAFIIVSNPSTPPTSRINLISCTMDFICTKSSNMFPWKGMRLIFCYPSWTVLLLWNCWRVWKYTDNPMQKNWTQKSEIASPHILRKFNSYFFSAMRWNDYMFL